MASDHGGRARRRDWTGQCLVNGMRFSALGDAADPRAGSKQTRAGDRYGSPWYRIDIFEMALANLLAAACRVELDDLDGHGIVEVGRRWVVERDVAVFAEADEGAVDRASGEQG